MQSIYNAAVRYLSRYNASERQLSDYLKRKFSQKVQQFDTKNQEVIAKLKQENFVNDNRYTANKIRMYLESGKSFYYIKMKLLEKGINTDVMEEEIANLEQSKEQLELYSAIRFAKKNKFLPFGNKAEEKDIAKMLRNGFNYKQVKQILESTTDQLNTIEKDIKI